MNEVQIVFLESILICQKGSVYMQTLLCIPVQISMFLPHGHANGRSGGHQPRFIRLRSVT